MPVVAAITGTRQTGHRELAWFDALFDAFLRPWADQDAGFYIGGAAGIDTLSLRWLARNSTARITIVVPGTAAQQPEQAREAMEHCRARIAELDTPAYHARNRYMVDRAQLVIGFPLTGPEGTSGTWQTLNYAASHGKPRLIVPV